MKSTTGLSTFCVEMPCLPEVILLIRKRQQKPAFSQFDYHIDI
jgi:hypothetical protein